MTKYIICRNAIVVNEIEKDNIVEGYTLNQFISHPKFVMAFGNLDDASLSLSNYESHFIFDNTNYIFEEYYIEEWEYDSNDKFVYGRNMGIFSKIPDHE